MKKWLMVLIGQVFSIRSAQRERSRQAWWEAQIAVQLEDLRRLNGMLRLLYELGQGIPIDAIGLHAYMRNEIQLGLDRCGSTFRFEAEERLDRLRFMSESEPSRTLN